MWTEERVAELKQLIAAGNSMGMIAQVWGVPRNAICGKAWRLGLSGPNNRNMGGIAVVFKKRTKKKARPSVFGENGATRITRLKRAKKTHYYAPIFRVVPDEPEPLRVSLLDLTDSHCHWVCEGTDDHCLPTYCGHPAVPDSSWCAHHYRRVCA